MLVLISYLSVRFVIYTCFLWAATLVLFIISYLTVHVNIVSLHDVSLAFFLWNDSISSLVSVCKLFSHLILPTVVGYSAPTERVTVHCRNDVKLDRYDGPVTFAGGFSLLEPFYHCSLPCAFLFLPAFCQCKDHLQRKYCFTLYF